MRGRGRGQLGSLGTLLPRQTSRLRLTTFVGARTSPDSNSDKDETTTNQTAADQISSPDAVTNTAPWRIAAASPGSGKRASRTAAAVAGRSTALRYAAWGWPVTPSTALPATADLEQVFATWSRLPDAPILAACGVEFDVIATHAPAGRTALARLDRLGVELGPVTIDSAGDVGFLVRAGSAAPLSALIDQSTGPTLIGRGAHFELPRTLEQPEPFRPTTASGRFWLRPPGTPRPALPTAHVVLGALALVPHRVPTTSPPPR